MQYFYLNCRSIRVRFSITTQRMDENNHDSRLFKYARV